MFPTWPFGLDWTVVKAAGLINSVVRLMAGRREVESWAALTPMLANNNNNDNGRDAYVEHACLLPAMYTTHVAAMRSKASHVEQCKHVVGFIAPVCRADASPMGCRWAGLEGVGGVPWRGVGGNCRLIR